MAFCLPPNREEVFKTLFIKFNKLLIIKQGQIDAQKMIDKKYFKKYYAGKPTKRYLKCLKQIEAAGGISMLGIVNGNYNNRPTSSIPQS